MKCIYLICLLALGCLSVQGQITNIDIGTGTTTSDNSPIQRNKNYSASELLFLSSEINNAGLITGLGFYKASGVNTVTIDSVYIYLKTTSATAIAASSSTTGYTLVYKGPFPNTATGWLTVNFNMVPGFNYSTSAGNLSVLTVRPFQASTTSRPFWRYTTYTGSSYNGWYANDAAAWSGTLGVSPWRPNTRLVFTATCSAPTAPTATNITTTTASLNWSQAGTPINYQIKYGPNGFNVNTGGTSVFTTTKPYTLNPPLVPLTAYSYYVRAICSPGDTSVWSPVNNFTTLCNAPSILSKKDSFNCGPGMVKLEASTTPGATLRWYNAAIGGTSLGSGGLFTTPSIAATTNYYVEAAGLAPAGSMGRNDYTGIATATPNSTGQGIRFNALSDINIDSVAVWVTNDTGKIIVQLQNSANAILRTDTFNFSGTGATATSRAKVYLKVNYSMATGNDYKILAMPGTTVPLSREQTVNPTFSGYAIANAITQVSSWVNGATNAANYYYFYNFYVSKGCASPRQQVIATIRSLPTVNIGNDTTICPGISYTFNAGNAGGNYLWSPDGQITQTITTNAAGQYAVKVTVNSCSKNDTIIITPGIAPVNNLSDSVNLCEGSEATLNAGNTGSTFVWSPGAATTQTVSVNSGGTKSVVIKSMDGCNLTSATYVKMRPLPVNNLGNDTSICESAVIMLDAGNTGNSYIWNTGATSQIINASDSGKYVVTVTTPYSCISKDSMHIAFLPEPRTEGFNFIPKFFEELGKVAFEPLSPVNVNTFEWDFGDNTPIVTAMNPTHVYAASGHYTVTLKVYNDCADFSRSQEINVDLPTGVVTVDKKDIKLTIYPNPAKSVLHISNASLDYQMEDVMVFNTVGTMVYHQSADSKIAHQMSVEHLSSGIYFVRILTDKGFVNQQVQIIK